MILYKTFRRVCTEKPTGKVTHVGLFLLLMVAAAIEALFIKISKTEAGVRSAQVLCILCSIGAVAALIYDLVR